MTLVSTYSCSVFLHYGTAVSVCGMCTVVGKTIYHGRAMLRWSVLSQFLRFKNEKNNYSRKPWFDQRPFAFPAEAGPHFIDTGEMEG